MILSLPTFPPSPPTPAHLPLRLARRLAISWAACACHSFFPSCVWHFIYSFIFSWSVVGNVLLFPFLSASVFFASLVPASQGSLLSFDLASGGRISSLPLQLLADAEGDVCSRFADSSPWATYSASVSFSFLVQNESNTRMYLIGLFFRE